MTTTPSPSPAPMQPVKKGGKAKWFILGGVGCVVLLFGACLIGSVILYFMSGSSLPNKYVNSPGHLNAKLQENYVPFSFSYPNGWRITEDGSKEDDSNYIKVEKSIKIAGEDVTLENFAVGWMSGSGSMLGDRALYPQLAGSLSTELSGGFPNYTRVSEGETRVNGYTAYELLFTSRIDKGSESVKLFGRVILISGGNVGEKNGAAIIMLASDKQSRVTSPADLGVYGDTGKILPTFKLGK